MTSRRVSFQQLEEMWEFLNTHKDIAVGFNKSVQARATSRRMWTELAESLNSIVGGAIKDWKNWSNYWVDYKGKLKRKCASIRASHSRTGGGPSTVPTLTEIELKFLSILGEDLGLGLPGIQVAVNRTITHATANEPLEPHLRDTAIYPPMAATLELDMNTDPPIIFTLPDQLPSLPNTQATQSVTQPIESIIQPTEPIIQPSQFTQSVEPRIVPTHPLRRLSRPTPMSQEAARRSLCESARMRAEATQDIARSLKNMENYLLRISDTLDSIHQR